jgi:hypothetical protein
MHNAFHYKQLQDINGFWRQLFYMVFSVQTPAVPLQQQKRLHSPHKGGGGAHGSPFKKKVALQQHQALASTSTALFRDWPGELRYCVQSMHLLQAPLVYCAALQLAAFCLTTPLQYSVSLLSRDSLVITIFKSALTCSDLMLQCL